MLTVGKGHFEEPEPRGESSLDEAAATVTGIDRRSESNVERNKKTTALNGGSVRQQAAAALAEPITLFRIILLT